MIDVTHSWTRADMARFLNVDLSVLSRFIERTEGMPKPELEAPLANGTVKFYNREDSKKIMDAFREYRKGKGY